jgi:hypothetical protein
MCEAAAKRNEVFPAIVSVFLLFSVIFGFELDFARL